eukprot:TRINITY_DN1676_c0_g1_i2.p1 TRINITY_DN1676_c0_g1~~TRINITY_DN1676_c0_g1_i2.p1  ORF type:complete len:211 (+),score=104.01 TRINITY_DN1676_c0_g1_i2:342-974(+)
MASGFFSKAQQQELDSLLKNDTKGGGSDDDDDEEEEEEEDDEESVEEKEYVKAGKKVTIPQSEKTNAAVNDGDEEYEESAEEEESEEEEEGDDDTAKAQSGPTKGAEDETAEEPKVAKTRKIKVVQRTRNGIQTSVVYTRKQGEDGESELKCKSTAEVDLTDILTKVRRMGERADTADFNRGLHRNVQKGRHKQGVKRHLQQHKDGGDYF